jgi:hypothetical protein
MHGYIVCADTITRTLINTSDSYTVQSVLDHKIKENDRTGSSLLQD